MSDLCRLIWCALIELLRRGLRWKSRSLSSDTNSTCCGASSRRSAFGNVDCLVFAGLYRVAPGVLDAPKILKPQTVICWHRGGFRAYWRWKSRPRGGRPKTPADICQLIRDMSIANPLWEYRAFMANCSSSDLRWPSRPSPGIWPAAARREARHP